MTGAAVAVRRAGGTAWRLTGVASLGMIAGFAAITDLRLSLLLALVPVIVWLLLNPSWSAALAIATLAVLIPLFGSEGGAAVVSTSDAFFALATAGLIPLLLLRAEWQSRLKTVKPLIVFTAPFVGWLVVVLGAHASGHSAFKTFTALEMTVIPMVLGAVMMNRRLVVVAITGLLLLTALLALVWVTGGDGSRIAGGKNYAGQLFSDAILLVIVMRGRLWLRVPMLGLYIGGLLFSASRGAIVATAFGAIALLAVRGLGSWKRTVSAVGGLAAAAVIGYNAVPVSVQQKVLSIVDDSSETKSQARSYLPSDDDDEAGLRYNVELRKIYRDDALALIRSHPVFGVGLGNYDTGAGMTRTVDPHNVVLRTAADGGVPSVLLFGLMVGGTGLVVARRLGRNPWAGPALALQVAILTHGFVDVYWVRGIPVLGWFLVGLAVNPLLDHRDQRVRLLPSWERRDVRELQPSA